MCRAMRDPASDGHVVIGDRTPVRSSTPEGEQPKMAEMLGFGVQVAVRISR